MTEEEKLRKLGNLRELLSWLKHLENQRLFLGLEKKLKLKSPYEAQKASIKLNNQQRVFVGKLARLMAGGIIFSLTYDEMSTMVEEVMMYSSSVYELTRIFSLPTRCGLPSGWFPNKRLRWGDWEKTPTKEQDLRLRELIVRFLLRRVQDHLAELKSGYTWPSEADELATVQSKIKANRRAFNAYHKKVKAARKERNRSLNVRKARRKRFLNAQEQLIKKFPAVLAFRENVKTHFCPPQQTLHKELLELISEY